MEQIYIVKRGEYSDEVDLLAFHEEIQAKKYIMRKKKIESGGNFWYHKIDLSDDYKKALQRDKDNEKQNEKKDILEQYDLKIEQLRQEKEEKLKEYEENNKESESESESENEFMDSDEELYNEEKEESKKKMSRADRSEQLDYIHKNLLHLLGN